MARMLIVNADDFGLTAGVNRGVIESHQRGIVTSATMMVNMPGFADAVAQAAGHPGLAVGLHLNLTYGRPLSPPEELPSLVDEDGGFVRREDHAPRNGAPAEIRAEFLAQARRFLATGLPLSHLDTHHHLHRAENLLDLVADLAGLLRVPVRCLDERAMRARGLAPLARYVDFFGGSRGVERLLALLPSLTDGITEIPCHPGYADDELCRLSPLNLEREWELRTMVDPRVAAAVAEGGIVLTNYLRLRTQTSPEEEPHDGRDPAPLL